MRSFVVSLDELSEHGASRLSDWARKQCVAHGFIEDVRAGVVQFAFVHSECTPLPRVRQKVSHLLAYWGVPRSRYERGWIRAIALDEFHAMLGQEPPKVTAERERERTAMEAEEQLQRERSQNELLLETRKKREEQERREKERSDKDSKRLKVKATIYKERKQSLRAAFDTWAVPTRARKQKAEEEQLARQREKIKRIRAEALTKGMHIVLPTDTDLDGIETYEDLKSRRP